MVFEIGRLCVKIAGRDAGLRCVVIEILEGNFVLIDGQTRRKKCNLKHLEPLETVLKIKAKATHADVVSEFKKLKLEIKETKPKKASERPKKFKKKKEPRNKEASENTAKPEIKTVVKNITEEKKTASKVKTTKESTPEKKKVVKKTTVKKKVITEKKK
ncbi:MAG: hypothetical protein ABIC91_02875 [Nanoarchaeota archaeon]|nr:hypothetical protein [Nanoarchaeota archaeon]MBU1030533.1 hypothetical protein [Nanoarchaeota archaeon]MBU1849489.1 hypothetical protein [Nanoarchaeota archaeon]